MVFLVRNLMVVSHTLSSFRRQTWRVCRDGHAQQYYSGCAGASCAMQVRCLLAAQMHHASIATEAKVVGSWPPKESTDLTREAFLEHAWTGHKHGGIILEQELTKAWRFVRLGLYSLHNGRTTFRKCAESFCRFIQQRPYLSRRSHG